MDLYQDYLVADNVVCWGWNRYGQSSLPDTKWFVWFSTSQGLGQTHTCIWMVDLEVNQDQLEVETDTVSIFNIKSNGRKEMKKERLINKFAKGDKESMKCQGSNLEGQLNVPGELLGIDPQGANRYVSTGQTHNCAWVEGEHQVKCWGNNKYKQCEVALQE